MRQLIKKIQKDNDRRRNLVSSKNKKEKEFGMWEKIKR